MTSDKKIKIEITPDMNWVKVSIGDTYIVVSKEEWSLLIARPGSFSKNLFPFNSK